MRSVGIVICLLMATALAHAEPAKPETVEAWFALSQAEQNFKADLMQLEQLMREAMRLATTRQTPLPGQQCFIDEGIAKVMPVVDAELSWEKLKPQFIKTYSETFTEDELRRLIALYRDPASQGLINQLSSVIKKSNTIIAAAEEAMTPKLKAAFQEEEAQEAIAQCFK